LISERLGEGRGSFLSIDDIEGVPLLQISLPVNFEKWDSEKPILVAYTPLTIDDIEVEEIYAYDSEGNEYVLDAKMPPDFPVIVVGINERVDPVTKKLYFGKDGASLGKPNPDDPPDPPNPPPGTTHIDVILDHVYLQDDGEPWTKGSPEIYCLLANSGGINNRYNMYSEWTGWGTNRSWHHVDLNMLEWHEEYSKTFGISFLEYDGGSTVTYTV